MFLSICLDDEEFGRELVQEGGWTSLTHAFTPNESRNAAKACWGIVQVRSAILASCALGHCVLSGSLYGSCKMWPYPRVGSTNQGHFDSFGVYSGLGSLYRVSERKIYIQFRRLLTSCSAGSIFSKRVFQATKLSNGNIKYQMII